MPRLEDLTDTARQGHLNFPAMEHDDAPFAPLRKPLSEAKLALVTTAGLHLRDDAPFASGDQTYRVIPSSSPASAIIQSHTSVGFASQICGRQPAFRALSCESAALLSADGHDDPRRSDTNSPRAVSK